MTPARPSSSYLAEPSGVRLRVCSGLHAGAEVHLGLGRWRVGAQADCDLVLLDCGLDDEPAVLVVTRASVRLERPRTSGSGIAEPDLPPDQAFRIGAVSLVHRREGTGDPPSDKSLGRAGHRWRIGVLTLTIVTLASAVVPIVLREDLASAHALTAPQPMPQAGQGLRPRLLERIGESAGNEWQLLPPDGEPETVEGWVADEDVRRRLQSLLAGVPVRVKVSVASEQVRFAEEYLRGQGHEVQVRYAGAGRLQVQARTSDESRLVEAVARLRQAAPLVRGIDIGPVAVSAPAGAAPAREPVAALAPGRLAGIDGISSAGRRTFMTQGAHYVFEGAVMRGGGIVRGIDEAVRALSDRAAPDDVRADDPSGVRRPSGTRGGR